MLMIVLLALTDSRKVIRMLRGWLLVVSFLLMIFGGPFAAMAGASIEAFNISGQSDNPGETPQQARDETWDWSTYGGWLIWLFIANFVLDWLVYRSDKKANS